MNNDTDKKDEKENNNDKRELARKLDENATLSVSDHLKIYDPNTNEVFLNKRDS